MVCLSCTSILLIAENFCFDQALMRTKFSTQSFIVMVVTIISHRTQPLYYSFQNSSFSSATYCWDGRRCSYCDKTFLSRCLQSESRRIPGIHSYAGKNSIIDNVSIGMILTTLDPIKFKLNGFITHLHHRWVSMASHFIGTQQEGEHLIEKKLSWKGTLVLIDGN